MTHALSTFARANPTGINTPPRTPSFPQQIWRLQSDTSKWCNALAPTTSLSYKLILSSPPVPPPPSNFMSMPLFVPSSPSTNPVPPAHERLAALFSEIASLGSFLLQARFVAPWSAPNRARYDEAVAQTLQADNVAEEMRAIDLAIYQLEAAKEINKQWMRNHCPGHEVLKDTTNGWST
jgi:hypothetical protein